MENIGAFLFFTNGQRKLIYDMKKYSCRQAKKGKLAYRTSSFFRYLKKYKIQKLKIKNR